MGEVNGSLKTKLQRFALLDAIIEPDWSSRYFSYDSAWDSENGISVASLRDGAGNEWFVWFAPTVTAYKVLSKSDGVMASLDDVVAFAADRFDAFLNEPAFSMDYNSAIWLHDGKVWTKFGSPKIEWLIDLEQVESWNADDFQTWAEDYYERSFSAEAIQRLYDGGFDRQACLALNEACEFAELKREFPTLVP